MVRTVVVLGLVMTAACGGGDGDEARAIDASVRRDSPRVIVASDTECRFDGDRQVVARGVVRNSGEQPYHVSISVRFLDAAGVRVDIASDSISDLEPGERSVGGERVQRGWRRRGALRGQRRRHLTFEPPGHRCFRSLVPTPREQVTESSVEPWAR